jgi:hypothetical protein
MNSELRTSELKKFSIRVVCCHRLGSSFKKTIYVYPLLNTKKDDSTSKNLKKKKDDVFL